MASSPFQNRPNRASSQAPKLKCIVLGGAAAGKTSLLRRYFHGTFDPARMPTLGSDFYSRKIPNPQCQPSDEDQRQACPSSNTASREEKKDGFSTPVIQHDYPIRASNAAQPQAVISMQVWDTPGRERFAANRKPMYTAAFSDHFFRNAHAALLVYDITSSTSFAHVLKWHADLMERIRRLEATGARTKPFPVLVVANKMDILRKREKYPSRQRAIVPQRTVTGLMNKSFRGKDMRYEYSASPAPPTSPNHTKSRKRSSSDASSHRNSRVEISTYMGTGDQTSYLATVLNNEDMKGSYLESLLSTEDSSHPDKDMVLLWCMRNGLKHMEVSALDGTGIEELMDEMVKMAMESLSAPEPEQDIQTATSTVDPSQLATELQRNEALDLHRRYAPKGRPCFRFLPFQRCCDP